MADFLGAHIRKFRNAIANLPIMEFSPSALKAIEAIGAGHVRKGWEAFRVINKPMDVPQLTSRSSEIWRQKSDPLRFACAKLNYRALCEDAGNWLKKRDCD